MLRLTKDLGIDWTATGEHHHAAPFANEDLSEMWWADAGQPTMVGAYHAQQSFAPHPDRSMARLRNLSCPQSGFLSDDCRRSPRDVDLKPVQDRLTALSRDVDNHNLLLWSMIAQGDMPVLPLGAH